jgi:hypothetical protein
MKLSLIFEEINVDNQNGQIEIFKTVRQGKMVVEKFDYSLKTLPQNLEEILLNLESDRLRYNILNQSLISKIFAKKNLPGLEKLILKNSEGCSWLIVPKQIKESLEKKDRFQNFKIWDFGFDNIWMGNYNSVTVLKKEDYFDFIQNSPLKMINLH